MRLLAAALLAVTSLDAADLLVAAASDLAEGLLNNVERPPVTARDNGRVLYEGRALPHFNEVDECAGLDALATNRVWTELGFDPETTVRFAQATSALNATGLGSQAGVTSFERTLEFMKHTRTRAKAGVAA